MPDYVHSYTPLFRESLTAQPELAPPVNGQWDLPSGGQ